MPLPYARICNFNPTSPSTYFYYFFFFKDPAPTEIYTLSLHDALPIYSIRACEEAARRGSRTGRRARNAVFRDRKSTRLNSSHVAISYAVFCLKKKKLKSIYPYGIENLVTEMQSHHAVHLKVTCASETQ